jgi:hypothetical protein
VAKEHEEKKHKGRKRARGGKMEMEGEKSKNAHLYNAHGSPAAKSAMEDKDDGFKKGGKVEKRKEGGHVEGEKPAERMDKRARGGHLKHGKAVHHGHGMKKYAAGGSPMSAAAHLTGPGKAAGAGHEGEEAKSVL